MQITEINNNDVTVLKLGKLKNSYDDSLREELRILNPKPVMENWNTIWTINLEKIKNLNII